MEGRLLIKPKLVFASWKSAHFIVDGTSLIRVKPMTATQQSQLQQQQQQQTQAPMPNLPQLNMNFPSVGSSSSTAPSTPTGGGEFQASRRNQHKFFQVLEKFFLGVAPPPPKSTAAAHNTNNSANANNNSPTRHVILKAVDGQPITGKPCTIGLFFNDRAPLVLRATDETTQAQWIQILSENIAKNQSAAQAATTVTSSAHTNHHFSPSTSPSSSFSVANGRNHHHHHQQQQVSSPPMFNIHTAVEAMIDAAVITDAFGDIQCVNSAFAHLFGYIPAEMLRMNVKSLMPESYANRHDRYMDVYRKGGEKRLIGVPRQLPIVTAHGTVRQVILSLGEIPGSSNTDKDRFLAVFKAQDTPIGQQQGSSNMLSSSSPNNSPSTLASTYSERDTASDQSDYTDLNTQSLSTSPSVSLASKLSAGLDRVETLLNDLSQSCLESTEARMRDLSERIAKLEATNEKLIAVTSQQTEALDFLVESIALCSSRNRAYSNSVTPTASPSLLSCSSATSSTSTSFCSMDLQQPQPSTVDLRSVVDRMTKEQQMMYRLLQDNEIIELDNILSMPIPFKHFILYSYWEKAEESCKFYLYITTQYKTENNLSVLLQKKDFIMETFVGIGSQFELNLASNMRRNIQALYESDLQRGKRWLDQCLQDQSDYDRNLLREQSFFNNLLSECKTCLLDTLMRFRKHPQYGQMKSEVSRLLCQEILLATRPTDEQAESGQPL